MKYMSEMLRSAQRRSLRKVELSNPTLPTLPDALLNISLICSKRSEGSSCGNSMEATIMAPELMHGL